MGKEDICRVEQEIDDSFAESTLISLGYSQAVWLLLSVVEDHHFKIRVYSPLDEKRLDMYTDGLLNAITHPLRVCLKDFPHLKTPINRSLVDEDYGVANAWLEKAESYDQFCSIFPLYHNGEINIEISGSKIITADWSKHDLSYEAYDRFIKRRHPEPPGITDPNLVAESVELNTIVTSDSFRLNFNPRLVKELKENIYGGYGLRFTLPSEWEFTYFSIFEFKDVFITIQAMSYGWFMARQIACAKGVSSYGFNSSLWTPKRTELVARLRRYTGVSQGKIDKIIEYLTFGEVGVRNPDIAIQPIVDLKSGEVAVSPFIFMNVNCERNLCVLLNQIGEERKIYSGLVEEKEKSLREEVMKILSDTDYSFKFGRIDDTDVDLAIIDRNKKECLVIELKWFIEPAEIREVIQRSKEIKKGVGQAKVISSAWKLGDSRLVNEVLQIDSDYKFLAIVASVTSIGNLSAQDEEVPVVKIWHLVDEIIHAGDLGVVIQWLKDRSYLPVKDIDFKVGELEINTGSWSSVWYGITNAEQA